MMPVSSLKFHGIWCSESCTLCGVIMYFYSYIPHLVSDWMILCIKYLHIMLLYVCTV